MATATATTTGPTLDQRRAKHAWERVENQKKDEPGRAEAVHAGPARRARVENQKKDEPGREYAREAKKLPMRIRAAGLGQALAFILAKAKDKKPNLKQLHDDLSDWVLEKRPMAGKAKGSLLESVIQGDSDFLRQATDEALAYLQWLNRFAEAKGLTDDQ